MLAQGCNEYIKTQSTRLYNGGWNKKAGVDGAPPVCPPLNKFDRGGVGSINTAGAVSTSKLIELNCRRYIFNRITGIVATDRFPLFIGSILGQRCFPINEGCNVVERCCAKRSM